MLASSAMASPSSTIGAAARAIARFLPDLEAQAEVEADLLTLLDGADAAADTGHETLAREARQVAADCDLGDRKDFRKFRNVKRIPSLEHLKHALHALMLREPEEFVAFVDRATLSA